MMTVFKAIENWQYENMMKIFNNKQISSLKRLQESIQFING